MLMFCVMAATKGHTKMRCHLELTPAKSVAGVKKNEDLQSQCRTYGCEAREAIANNFCSWYFLLLVKNYHLFLKAGGNQLGSNQHREEISYGF